MSAHLHDPVPALDPGLPFDRLRIHRPHNGWIHQHRQTDGPDDAGDDHGEHDIHRRPGNSDQDARQRGCRRCIPGSFPFDGLRSDHLGQLHKSTRRNPTDGPFNAINLPSKHLGAEADGKPLNPHAATAGHPVMSILMDKDAGAKQGQHGHGHIKYAHDGFHTGRGNLRAPRAGGNAEKQPRLAFGSSPRSTVATPSMSQDLFTAFAASASARPDKTALHWGREQFTYHRFLTQSHWVARRLRNDFGVQPGDRVAIWLKNRPEFIPALLGILAAGAVAVPVNNFLKSGEVEYLLTDSGAQVVITEESAHDTLAPILASRPGLRVLLAEEIPAATGFPTVASSPDVPPIWPS